MKSTKYRYSNQLTSDWVHDRLPEGGGHYVSGASCRLEADNDKLYLGHKSVLLAVKNQQLGLFIIHALDGCSFSGGACQSLREIASVKSGFSVTSFVPKGIRVNKWNARNYTPGDPRTDVEVIMVNRVTEDMVDCDLETLTPHLLTRYGRVITSVAKNSRKANWEAFGTWRGPEGTTPAQYLYDLFAKIGIPWPDEWAQKIARESAKRRLSSSNK